MFLLTIGYSARVLMSRSYSEFVNVPSGVIQGNVLGPLLFLLYVNDVADIFNGNCVYKLYADDIKLYSVLDSANDCSDLQCQLNDLQQWLNISYKKCNTLFIGSQRLKPQHCLK